MYPSTYVEKSSTLFQNSTHGFFILQKCHTYRKRTVFQKFTLIFIEILMSFRNPSVASQDLRGPTSWKTSLFCCCYFEYFISILLKIHPKAGDHVFVKTIYSIRYLLFFIQSEIHIPDSERPLIAMSGLQGLGLFNQF